MEDKLQDFFSENDFDTHVPNVGHEARFQKKLQRKKNKKKPTWGWLSIAASITLILGFSLGTFLNKDVTSNQVASNIENVEGYFVNMINIEMQEIERNRSLETEDIIENALDELEELEDSYQIFFKSLDQNGDQVKVVKEMISNYQKRLDILQDAINQIELVKNPKILEPDTII